MCAVSDVDVRCQSVPLLEEALPGASLFLIPIWGKVARHTLCLSLSGTLTVDESLFRNFGLQSIVEK